jgi:hypothetical protein
LWSFVARRLQFEAIDHVQRIRVRAGVGYRHRCSEFRAFRARLRGLKIRKLTNRQVGDVVLTPHGLDIVALRDQPDAELVERAFGWLA